MATRTVNEAFNVFVKRLTPSDTERAAGKGHRASIKDALEASLDVISFSETGSFSHGTGVSGYSDIDALVCIKNPKPDTSFTALTSVKDVLKKRFPLTAVEIRRPAVVVKFAGGYETWEVIPGYMTARGTKDQYVYDIPSPTSGGAWIDSAPKEHLAYVDECNASPNKGNAKALARLVKAWKYYRNVPISSFYLEMRCAQHVATLETYVHVWDVCLLLEKLVGHQLAAMNDPKKASGQIKPCSSDAQREDALSKLATAATRARRAVDYYKVGNDVDAFLYLNLLFNNKFPARIY